jgi:glycosyltransferase involved in cell wall biosynthesis
MQIWAIGTTRNEADVISLNVRHHLAQGVNHFLWLDDGSTDETQRILQSLSETVSLDWRRHFGPFQQSTLLTQLAREAFIRGADWVLPLDADELWSAPGSTIRAVLESSTAGALRVQVVNFVQDKASAAMGPEALVSMTFRPRLPVEPIDVAQELVEAGQIAFVEILYPTKSIARTAATLEIGWGNHYLLGNRNPVKETAAIVCLHAPLRSRAALQQKADSTRPDNELHEYLRRAWHVRRWRRLAAEGRLDDEWRANSYEDGCLNLNGHQRPLVVDTRLREAALNVIECRERKGGSAPLDSNGRVHPNRTAVAVPTPGPPTSPWIRRYADEVRVWGLSIVRNEVDIIRTNLLHHLRLGLERILVVDNGSDDGTDLVLQELSRTLPIEWRSSPGPFRQAQMTTDLAREAYGRGATWVLPVDADEFWCTNGQGLEDVLAQSAVAALGCHVMNFVQSRDQLEATPDAIARIVFRPARVRGPVENARLTVESRKAAFVEMAYPRKWITRAMPGIRIAQGNHDVDGIVGEVAHTDGLVCLHAPLRARSTLLAQVEHGQRLDLLGLPSDFGWHVRRWHRIHQAEGLEREWAANSERDGHLDVYGTPHDLVRDHRLQELIAVAATLPTTNVTDRLPALVARPGDWAQNSAAGIVAATPVDSGTDRIDRDALISSMRKIEGWLLEQEADLLARTLARAMREAGPSHAVVEIGSYAGRSTLILAGTVRALEPQATVFAVDPHLGEVGAIDSAIGFERKPGTLPLFLDNMSKAGLLGSVTVIPQRSFEVQWARPVSFLYVDGLHDRLSVAQDVAHFVEWLLVGAYIAFHDCSETFPGVQQCVENLLTSGEFTKVDQVGTLIVLRRQANPSHPAVPEGRTGHVLPVIHVTT